MKQTFTKEDIILDVYGESNHFDHLLLKNIRKVDSDKQVFYKQIKDAKSLIDDFSIQPPQYLIDAILDRSQNSLLSM